MNTRRPSVDYIYLRHVILNRHRVVTGEQRVYTSAWIFFRHTLLEFFPVNKRETSGSKVAGTFTRGSVN